MDRAIERGNRRDRPALVSICCGILFVTALWGAPATASGKPAFAPLVRPNIVLILTDDQSYESIPHSPAVMPYLQSQILDASSHWIRFTNMFFNVSLCCPSRATILTGRYDTHTGVTNNGQGQNLDESSTIATWLHTAGYRTGFFGKYLNNYPWARGNYVPAGWDSWAAFNDSGDNRYYDYTLNVQGTTVSYGTDPSDYSTTVLEQMALGFLQGTSPDQPFFMEFAPRAPHPPSIPAPGDSGTYKILAPYRYPSFNEADVSDKPAWIQALPLLSSRGIKHEDAGRRKSYESLIQVDRSIHAFMDQLASTGQLSNTVIVYMTDNGYAFGEHRLHGKVCPYEQCSRTPFLVYYPSVSGDTTVPALSSNIDVAPTLAAVAGVTPAGPVDGLSLTPFITGPSPTSWPDGVLMRWVGSGNRSPAYWAIRTPDYMYDELPVTNEKELYDLTGQLGPADPDELQNVAGEPAYASVQSQLANQLHQMETRATSPLS